MRPKTSGRAARPLSAMIAGGAVLVGITLLFGTAPDQLQTATAASTPTIIRFTVNEGTNISITRPSTGQWIIMDLHGFLYRIPPQGGQAVRITDVFQDAARPEISPNGQRIAFQGYDATNGGYFHVVLVNPDGSGVQRLTSGNYDHREPVWSRDGTRVAFASDRPTGQLRPPLVDAALGSYNIWSMDVATGALKLWADTLTAEEGEPTWSPDNTEIAYVVSNRIEAVNEAGVRRTIIAAVSGRTINSPSWAPAGTDIAYIGSGGSDADLWVGNRRITTGQDVFRFSRPQWISANEIMYAADGKIRVVDISTMAFRDVPFSATLEMPDLAYKTKKYDFDRQRAATGVGNRHARTEPRREVGRVPGAERPLGHGDRQEAEAPHGRLVLRSRPCMVGRRPLPRVLVGQGGDRGHLRARHGHEHRAQGDVAERRGSLGGVVARRADDRLPESGIPDTHRGRRHRPVASSAPGALRTREAELVA